MTTQLMRSKAVLYFALAGASVASCGSSDTRPAEWDYISPVITEPSCATGSCHSQGTAAAGLDFSDANSGYTSLTGLWVWIVDPKGTLEEGCKMVGDLNVCQRNHRPLVTPYDPAQSKLIQMLRGPNATRMPPDRPLPEGDIALIELWILNGARRRPNDQSADARPSSPSKPDAGKDAGDGG